MRDQSLSATWAQYYYKMDESQPINFSGDAAPMHIHKKGCWGYIHDLMARLPVSPSWASYDRLRPAPVIVPL